MILPERLESAATGRLTALTQMQFLSGRDSKSHRRLLCLTLLPVIQYDADSRWNRVVVKLFRAGNQVLSLSNSPA
jgi:hypothetical protein